MKKHIARAKRYKVLFIGCTFQNVSDVSSSVVIQGNDGDCSAINGSGTIVNTALDESEAELLRVYRSLPIREKIKLCSYAYSLENGGVHIAEEK